MKEGVTGEINAETRMQFLMDFSDGKSKTITLEKNDGSSQTIELTESTTISDVLNQLKDAGHLTARHICSLRQTVHLHALNAFGRIAAGKHAYKTD